MKKKKQGTVLKQQLTVVTQDFYRYMLQLYQCFTITFLIFTEKLHYHCFCFFFLFTKRTAKINSLVMCFAAITVTHQQRKTSVDDMHANTLYLQSAIWEIE